MKPVIVAAGHETDDARLTTASSASSSSTTTSSAAAVVESHSQVIPLPGPSIETGSTVDKIMSSSSPTTAVSVAVS